MYPLAGTSFASGRRSLHVGALVAEVGVATGKGIEAAVGSDLILDAV